MNQTETATTLILTETEMNALMTMIESFAGLEDKVPGLAELKEKVL